MKMVLHIVRVIVLLTVVICCQSMTLVPVREAVRMLIVMPRFVYWLSNIVCSV